MLASYPFIKSDNALYWSWAKAYTKQNKEVNLFLSKIIEISKQENV